MINVRVNYDWLLGCMFGQTATAQKPYVDAFAKSLDIYSVASEFKQRINMLKLMV